MRVENASLVGRCCVKNRTMKLTWGRNPQRRDWKPQTESDEIERLDGEMIVVDVGSTTTERSVGVLPNKSGDTRTRVEAEVEAEDWELVSVNVVAYRGSPKVEQKSPKPPRRYYCHTRDQIMVAGVHKF
ncbi:hypothetical protein AG1IA_09005 [Rhizoctonia solani AG-1 IA]|uniref:Uncharacterized protein n=1 Tax=Thanatephorus cucumeris (strain AG1-IA) TaxID=983506 RepID=L8WJQ6_THACA|nr:hypothetical protein AG1IA_09005 [Rhizoctonia solani AG-1 IA]